MICNRILLFIGLFIAVPIQSRPCTCEQYKTPQELYRDARTVVRAAFLRAERVVWRDGAYLTCNDPEVFYAAPEKERAEMMTMVVRRAYKGASFGDTLYILTDANTCGYSPYARPRFAEHILFLSEPDWYRAEDPTIVFLSSRRILYTNVCSGNRRVSLPPFLLGIERQYAKEYLSDLFFYGRRLEDILESIED